MKIVELNTTYYGSTGKIMLQIADSARQSEHIVKTFSKRWKNNGFVNEYHQYLGTRIGNILHRILGPLTAKEGDFSTFTTLYLIKYLKRLSPNIIHLHNLHGWYLNYKLLFKYIKRNKVKVVWTLHDCWAFTGHCPYFTLVKCNKWKTQCKHCPQYRDYPQSYLDNSERMYKLKKTWFTGISDMTIVTPSEWLADLVRQSFFKEYPVRVIHNGIDLSVFQPTESNFKEKYHIEKDKKILLGVAFGWGIRKGLDVFVELSKRLDEHYQIVLVGTDDTVDKQLPDPIISIHRTQNQKELAEIYTAADLFVNPTREDNYPTVNMESLACGTPILTFRTGGSPEIPDETCGSVVECDDIDAMEREIVRICADKPYSEEACLRRARNFDMNERFEEYIRLYEMGET